MCMTTKVMLSDAEAECIFRSGDASLPSPPGGGGDIGGSGDACVGGATLEDGGTIDGAHENVQCRVPVDAIVL
eukprot:SAG31_NODE_7276_length_1736_cov_2.824679_2_plen_73_part_00